MATKPSGRRATAHLADFGPPEQRHTVVIDDLTDGARVIAKRARRCDPLDNLVISGPQRCAAVIYRQAWEHTGAGRGMGPLPWGRDVPSGRGGEMLPPQMRALSAAVLYRRGVQAAGMIASEGVLAWVVLAGRSLATYDADRRQREGRGRVELVAALERMSKEYGL